MEPYTGKVHIKYFLTGQKVFNNKNSLDLNSVKTKMFPKSDFSLKEINKTFNHPNNSKSINNNYFEFGKVFIIVEDLNNSLHLYINSEYNLL